MRDRGRNLRQQASAKVTLAQCSRHFKMTAIVYENSNVIRFRTKTTIYGRVAPFISVLLSLPAMLLQALINFCRPHSNLETSTRSAQTPSVAHFLLYLFLNKKDRQTIPGDLQEEFQTTILPQFGPRRAKLWYWSHTLTNIAYRNPIIKWALAGGGILKLTDWLIRRISG